MEDEFDKKIKDALQPLEKPDFWLNQKILNHNKGAAFMQKKKLGWIKKPSFIAAVICFALVGSVGAIAASRFFSPKEIAQELGNKKLAKAFEGRLSKEIMKTQKSEDYTITLLGMVSGKDISDIKEIGTNVVKEKTYVAIAIEKTDGTKIPDKDENGEYISYTDQFLASPLIEGYNPLQYNVYTMDGGVMYFVRDGILYWVVESDNVEIFANNKIYLSICAGGFSSIARAYNYDEKTGAITQNKSYDGVNALFELPIDKSKASEEKVKDYINSMQ